MKIAIVSKSTAAGGGASRFAEDLADWLGIAGHQVAHFCADLPISHRSFQFPLYCNSFYGRLCRFIHRRGRQYGFNEILPVEAFTPIFRNLRYYDAVHFHDHYTAFSLITVGLLATHKRVFFTAHDCLHITGNGTYPPLLKRPMDITSLASRLSKKANRLVAEQCAVTYIYPSRWLMNEAKAVIDFKHEPLLLPYGFDPTAYNFQPRAEARRRLGLPIDQPILCISAHYLSDPRKGVEYALRAVASVRDMNPLVIFVGNPVSCVEQHLTGVNYWFAGYVEARPRLGLLLAAADVFLFCTLQDNLPISVQESMGAATPVVGFATGGVPEMVEHGRSAWLVQTGNQSALNRALREALLSKFRAVRGEAAQADLAEKFSVKSCVQYHEALYKMGSDQ